MKDNNVYENAIFFVKIRGVKMEKLLVLSEHNKSEILKYMPQSDVTNRLASYFQNFADYTRLRIIICLSLCDMCVNDLAVLLNVNQTTISHQLKILKAQNMVKFHRDGKILLYTLKNKNVNEVMLGAINSLS